MDQRIGLLICDCGGNISEGIDTETLCQVFAEDSDITAVHRLALWCSEEGRAEIVRLIRADNLTHVVVAACSPRQHEETFRKALETAGLNPFLMQMANIREHVAWVTPDKALATQRARVQIEAAVARVKHQVPLEKREIACHVDALVIGAGVAGISAALALAQKGRRVTLVERSPWIGGKVVAYEDAFPDLECAPCMLEPKMDHILHDENITLLTNSEVTNLRGYFGNFEVTIKSKARRITEEACMGCGMCFEPCPVTVRNRFEGGLADRHAIYTAFAGVLPNVPIVDDATCLRFQGQECSACADACMFGAVDFDQQDSEQTIEVGTIVVATGFDLLDVKSLPNLAPDAPDVIDAYQFERMIAREGFTEGKVLKQNGEPPVSIAFIHCAGSRSAEHKPYCSSVCCADNLKLAHLAQERTPGLKVYSVFSDWCLGGNGYAEMYARLAGDIEQVRVTDPNLLQVTPEPGGFAITGEGCSIHAEMVILATAMVPSEGAGRLAKLLGLPQNRHGFFAAEHERVGPAATTARGIFIAGCASGPKDIPSSVLQGQAAAGLALSATVPGEQLELEAATAEVISERCGACHVCLPLCPYQAINAESENGAAEINAALCHGCGVCASACPSGAIRNRHFTDEQIYAEIEGALK